MSDPNASSLEKPSDLGKSPEAVARRWKLELKLASTREEKWRKKAKDIYELYTPPDNAPNSSFNILWSNTETLRQAVYNSLPQPQVVRRYSDEDELGKNVSNVLTRALEFSQDTYDFDKVLKDDVLCMLLPGRAISRVKYIPDIQTIPKDSPTSEAGAMVLEESNINTDEDAEESESYEQIGWEQVICERVQYDDFRILCAAKTWDSVTAIGFRHRLNREDLIEKFGDEIGKAITLDSTDNDDINKSSDLDDLFKTAEVWEIWNKDDKEVIFICESYANPCKIQPDPLNLQGFFPIPRPLYAIENDNTLVPTSLYTQYRQQAIALNKACTRIDKLVDALKLRGVYDATLNELSQLMKGEDNDLIPCQNAVSLIERGGLEKAIYYLPIDMAANVIKVLFEQRDSAKQIIYEITGISDIMRSASDPNETFGAQKIKTQWGTQRLQRMQKEVQRYIRDLIRLKAEIIAEKFQMETLEGMTLIDLPHQAQVDQANAAAMNQYQMAKSQAIQQYHAQAIQAHQQNQPPPPIPQDPGAPQPQNPITWEQVMGAMRDDATRTYHIDIESDSTLSASQDSDMAGLQEVLGAVNHLVTGFAPMVQQGVLPFEAMKEILMAVVRRAKMGSAVEDALNKIEPPPPPPPAPPNPDIIKAQTEQMKAQTQAQTEQAKLQQEMQLEQMRQQGVQQQAQLDMQMQKYKAQLDASVDAAAQEAQGRQAAQQIALEAHTESLKQNNEMLLEKMRMQADERNAQLQQQIQLLVAHMNNQTKIDVAEITAGATLQTAQIAAAKAGSEE